MTRSAPDTWMLEEVGQPYRTELLDYGTTMKAPEYLAINPMGKVPALRHRDVVVTECAAICCYLADAFPAVGLAPPPGDALRGPYYRWMFFAAGPLEAVTTNNAFGFEVPAERKAMAGYGSLAEVTAVLEAALAGREHLVGERFTAADVYVGSHIGWGMSFGTIDKRAVFERYFERISTRPAATRAREIDDALIADAKPASGAS